MSYAHTPGARDREYFLEQMKAIAIGATLSRRKRVWTVTQQKQRETGIEVLLKHGRKTLSVQVPVCHSGPCLADVGLRPIALAPQQKELL